jgi:hypothetical protein
MAGQHIAAADAPAAATLPPDTVSADTQLTESEKETEKNTHVGAVADGPRTEEAQAPEAAEPEKAATSPAAPPAAEKLSRGKIVVIMAALGVRISVSRPLRQLRKPTRLLCGTTWRLKILRGSIG